jgi:hypothetical protein
MKPSPPGRRVAGSIHRISRAYRCRFNQAESTLTLEPDDDGNSGLCAVARAAGFVHEGTLRESFRYADGIYHDEHVHGLLAADATAAGSR